MEARNGSDAMAIKASVDLDKAGAPGVVFRIELSRPAERTVVLIYGTVDGTAKAGEDYEPRQGVLTLAPGTRSADVRVPLIEPRRAGGDSRIRAFSDGGPQGRDHRRTADHRHHPGRRLTPSAPEQHR